MDKKFLLSALGYGILGLALGLVMAATKNHGQMVTHAHVLLVGFVLSFIYALCHKLWLRNVSGALAQVQFYAHQLGALFLSIGLFLYYGQFVSVERIDPWLSGASMAVFVGLILMKVLCIKHLRRGELAASTSV